MGGLAPSKIKARQRRRSFTPSCPHPSPSGSVHLVTKSLIGLERKIRRHLERLPPAARAELAHVLPLRDFDRIEVIGDYWANPKTRPFAKLLLECEENRAARQLLVGTLQARHQSSLLT
jgi:hypothetical protein